MMQVIKSAFRLVPLGAERSCDLLPFLCVLSRVSLMDSPEHTHAWQWVEDMLSLSDGLWVCPLCGAVKSEDGANTVGKTDGIPR
jgi:hypothetical protein